MSMTSKRFWFNPANAVGGSFIFSLHEARADFPNPTSRVGRSFILSLHGTRAGFPNPTNEVGGIWSPKP